MVAKGFDVEVDALIGPDCTSTANALGVGVLDIADAGRSNGNGYVALVDIPLPPNEALVDVAVETFSLDRGAFSDVALSEPRRSIVSVVVPTREAETPILLEPLLGAERGVQLVDAAAEREMASDSALAKILEENGRVRLGIVARVVGNQPAVLSIGSQAAPAPSDHAPFEFQSAPFVANIDLCNGCLASPTSCPDGSAPIPNPASCNLGQDVPAEVCP